MRRYFVAIVLSAVCITGGMVGGSMAYLSETHSKNNTFTFLDTEAIDCRISEPSWKTENGRLILPGMTIRKDPILTNTSKQDIDEAVALKVEFVYGKQGKAAEKAGQLLSDEDMQLIKKVFQIDWNSEKLEDWIRFPEEDGSMQTQHFYYNRILKRNMKQSPKQGESTVPLFTAISVPKEIQEDVFSKVQEMGGFEIKISGCALQSTQSEMKDENSVKEICEKGLFTFKGGTDKV